MEAERADHPVEDDDRRCEAGPDVEADEVVDPAEGRILELRVVLDVTRCDRPPLLDREVRHEQVRLTIRKRIDAWGVPLRADRCGLARLAEPDEAAHDVRRLAHFLDGDSEQRLDVVLGADTLADRHDQPFALERFFQLRGRAGLLESQRGLTGERFQPRDLVRRKRAAPGGARSDHDGEDARGRDDGDEGGALRADAIGEPPVDARRGLDVEDRQRRRLEHGARDRRGLVLEIEGDRRPPLHVLAVGSGDEPCRVLAVIGDQRDSRELHAEDRDDLVQERAADRGRVSRARKPGEENCRLVRPARLVRHGSVGLVAVTTPICEESEHGRDEQHRRQGEQQVADSDREQHWAPLMIRRGGAAPKQNEGGPSLGGVGAAGTP
jgi:hypothetical protein